MSENFDAKEKLHSVPVRLGGGKALAISAICYIASISAMIYAGILAQRKIAYWIALIFIGAIFFFQQKLARDDDISDSIKKFFKINMYISPILFFGTLIDVIMS